MGRNTWNCNWWRHWSHLLMWGNGHLLSKRGCRFALHNLEVLFPLFWKKPLGTRWLRDLVIEYEPSHLSIDHSNMTYCVSHRKASDYSLVSCTKWDTHPLLQPSSSWTDFPVEIAGFCSGNLTFSFKKIKFAWAASCSKLLAGTKLSLTAAPALTQMSASDTEKGWLWDRSV